MSVLRRSMLVAAMGATIFTLAGCGQDVSSSGATSEASAAKSSANAKPTLEELQKITRGFAVGNSMAAARVIVFFDPRCPHCGNLWHEIKPLLKAMHFVWVPVGLVNPQSMGQGAALLAEADPVAAMEKQKTAMLSGKPGISVGKLPPEILDAVKENTRIMEKLGATSVPYLVGRHATSGATIETPGSLPAAALAAKFGAPAPSNPE